MRRLPPSRRLLLLMPLAAWSVHQLRYFLAYGPAAPRQLSDQGHAYLVALVPVIAGLAAIALGGFLLRCAKAWRDGAAETGRRHGIGRLWAVTVAGLASIYVSQELVEGMLARGHPAPGLAALAGHGGWLALPAAMLVGALVVLGLRGADAVESMIARGRSPAAHRASPLTVPLPASAALATAAPLARMGAGRAPPIAAMTV